MTKSINCDEGFLPQAKFFSLGEAGIVRYVVLLCILRSMFLKASCILHWTARFVPSSVGRGLSKTGIDPRWLSVWFSLNQRTSSDIPQYHGWVFQKNQITAFYDHWLIYYWLFHESCQSFEVSQITGTTLFFHSHKLKTNKKNWYWCISNLRFFK